LIYNTKIQSKINGQNHRRGRQKGKAKERPNNTQPAGTQKIERACMMSPIA